ncbi:MAG: alpha/beta fold hydrolase [Bacteroidota bacterium]
MTPRPSRTIVLITGAFISHHCWDQWIPFFESNGFNVIVPPWPFKDDSPEALRNQDLTGNIATNRLSTIVAYFRDIVREQNEKPILIGHSIGGLIVQLLMQEDLGSAGIAIHSVPPQGIMTFKLSF